MNRNRKFLLIAGAVCALAPLAGCLVLPFPHYRDHLPVCSGVVVDAATGMPVGGASVTATTSRYSGTAVSDEKGRFSIDGTGGWHWIVWIATPSSGSFFPTHLHPQDEWLTGLRVQRKGAEDKSLSLEDLPDCGLCGGTNFVLKVDATEFVIAGMKRLHVREFFGKAGESLSEVVGRLFAISRAGLPGLPEDQNGISLLLTTRSGRSEEPLASAFSVRDVSFYEAVETFCKAAGYQFKVDGGCLRIAPAEVELRDFASPELREAELCGHGSVSPEERELLHQMQEMRLPTISFRPPATLKDAVEFFRSASAPVGEREKAIDICVEAVTDACGTEPLPKIAATDISFYEAIKLIADCAEFRLEIRGKKVILKESDGCELLTLKFGGEDND